MTALETAPPTTALDRSVQQDEPTMTRFGAVWKMANLFARSAMIPAHYRGKVEDCFIALQMADRLGIDAFMLMQNTYNVQGKPGIEAKLAIALINSSGKFVGMLKYKLTGTGDARKAEAYATEKATAETVTGPEVSVKMAKDEGWFQRNPKWKNMTDLMLCYRAASIFGRLYCPERLMGMQTTDELIDAGQTTISNTPSSTSTDALNRQLGLREPDPVTEAEVAEQAHAAAEESQVNPEADAAAESQLPPAGTNVLTGEVTDAAPAAGDETPVPRSIEWLTETVMNKAPASLAPDAVDAAVKKALALEAKPWGKLPVQRRLQIQHEAVAGMWPKFDAKTATE